LYLYLLILLSVRFVCLVLLLLNSYYHRKLLPLLLFFSLSDGCCSNAGFLVTDAALNSANSWWCCCNDCWSRCCCSSRQSFLVCFVDFRYSGNSFLNHDSETHIIVNDWEIMSLSCVLFTFRSEASSFISPICRMRWVFLTFRHPYYCNIFQLMESFYFRIWVWIWVHLSDSLCIIYCIYY